MEKNKAKRNDKILWIRKEITKKDKTKMEMDSKRYAGIIKKMLGKFEEIEIKASGFRNCILAYEVVLDQVCTAGNYGRKVLKNEVIKTTTIERENKNKEFYKMPLFEAVIIRGDK